MIFRVTDVLKYRLVFVCLCVCEFPSSKNDLVKKGKKIFFSCSLSQDWIVIAWLSQTKLYIFCHMTHYKQQLWEGTLEPVIIPMKQKDCIPSEVNFSRSQIKILSANSKRAGNRAQITGGSDWLFGLVFPGHCRKPDWTSCQSQVALQVWSRCMGRITQQSWEITKWKVVLNQKCIITKSTKC